MTKAESVQLMTDKMAKFVGYIGIKLPDDVIAKLSELREKETSPLAKTIYDTMFKNQEQAVALHRPSCQDTGVLQFWVKCGVNFPLMGELEDLLREAAGGPLWMNAYSAKQFRETPDGLRVSPDFLAEAGPGELCFVEDQDLSPWAERLEKLIVYRWNRTYPADTWFTLPLEGWRLERTAEFAGSSHEKITKEVYVR